MSISTILVEIAGYQTARAILPRVSFGWARVADLTSETPGGWLGCYRDEQRRLVFTSHIASWIGLVLWLAPLIAFIVATGR